MAKHLIRSAKVNTGTAEDPAIVPALAPLVGTWGCQEDGPDSMVVAVECDDDTLAQILADPRNGGCSSAVAGATGAIKGH